ncbi:MAG: S8 family serine peptidase [Ruminococcus sp.]
MKHVFKRMLAALTGAATAASMLTALGTGMVIAQAEPDSSTVETDLAAPEGEVIVMYHGTTEMQSSALSKSLGSTVAVSESYVFDVPENTTAGRAFTQRQSLLQTGSSSDFTVSLVKSDTLSTSQLIALLEEDPSVMYASPNFRIQAASYSQDTYSDYQWALNNTGQNGGTPGLDINADTEALTPSADAGEQVVALVDTGIDYTHPDLAERMWENPYVGTGKLNGVHGYDFANMDDDPMDDNGHGSHCAGIIAAQADNDTGVSGVATSDSTRLMALKMLDSEGNSYGSEQFACYHYIYQAQLLGVNVVAINNSWGEYIPEDAPESEVEAYLSMFQVMIDLTGEMGAVTICASGNSCVDHDILKDYPSNIDSPYVISVAASDENDELAYFSDYGAESVDLAAPGTDILSTVCYDTMNAAFLTDEQKERLLYWYESFDGRTLEAGDMTSGAVPAPGGDAALTYSVEAPEDGSVITVETTSDTYFGTASENSASLKFTVENAVAGGRYSLRLPYYGQGGTKETQLSLMLRREAEPNSDEDAYWDDLPYTAFFISDGIVSEDGRYQAENATNLIGAGMYETENRWNAVQRSLTPHDEGQLCAISIDFVCAYSGTYTLYLDDLAMSRLGASEEELFQPYDFYSGTSMAAPMVTGAAAAIAAAYPELSARERTALLLGCTRPSEALEGMVKTGGVLDLSKLEDPNPIVLESWIIPEEGTMYLDGSQLTKMAFLIDGAPASVVEQSDSLVVLDVSAYVNQEFQLTAQYGETASTEYHYYSDGEMPDMLYYDVSMDASIDEYGFFVTGGNLLTVDENVYYCDAYGDVYLTLPDEYNANWTWLGGLDFTLLCTDDYDPILPGYMLSRFVTDGTSIYTVASLDHGYMQRSVLLEFSLETWEWSFVCELPDEFATIMEPIVGFYDGELVVMGGYDANDELHTTCASFDFEEGLWTYLPELPEGAYGGAAEQIGDKLYVSMQSGEEGVMEAIWSCDYTAWNENAALLPSLAQNVMHPENVSVSAYGSQLVYAGVPANGLGDVFAVDIEGDAVIDLGYTVTQTAMGKFCTSTVNGNVLYVLYQSGEVVEMELISLDGSPVISTADAARGDATLDGEINGDDAYQVLYYYACSSAGMEDVTFTDGSDILRELDAWNAADVNQDMEITADDAYWILLYYANISVGRDITWDDILAVG